ncbi:hypothetical protein ACFLW2_03180 [Chloroflexota bacterium]
MEACEQEGRIDMAKLCPLLVSTADLKQHPCTGEKCAWWLEVEEHEDGGMCSIIVIAYNSGYLDHDHCEHE